MKNEQSLGFQQKLKLFSFLSILVMFLLEVNGVDSQNNKAKEINYNDMNVSWKYEDKFLIFRMRSKSKGWMAIGFNETSELKGTKLIMGAITKDSVVVSERYIIEPGVHKSLTELGLKEEIQIQNYKEVNGIKEIEFKLPVASKQKFSKNLTRGNKIHLLIAYSLENDFMHHSISRTSIPIEL
ncbi:MAG: DOMON domain-containing protein [Leptospiraceae bacterium]|nr:DOMON domain-containing protein [Leptospiraceae bacterium]